MVGTKIVSRDDIQHAAFQAWIEAGRKGACLMGTGIGKTLLGIWAVNNCIQCALRPPEALNILWLTNSEKLRDEGSKQDFEKWGAGYLWQYVQAECYQTAYKLPKKHYDLVVCDEVDFALTEEYSKFFFNNKYEELLLLTATVKEEKQELLASICPVVYSYSTQQAQADGLLNQTQFVLLEVDLSEQKNIEVKYKKNGQEKSFYTSENDQYQYLETQFGIQVGEQDQLKKSLWRTEQAGGNPKALQDSLKKVEAKIQRLISQRTTALWTSPTLIAAGKALANKILTEENNKVVLFSKRKETAEALGSNVYHSGNKKDNQAIELFNSGEKRGLSVVDAVNRGVNLVGANYLVYVGFHSSGVDFQQRHGRGVRLAADQVCTQIILLPYYRNKTGQRKPTQAVKWFEGSTQDFELSTATRMSLTEYLQI